MPATLATFFLNQRLQCFETFPRPSSKQLLERSLDINPVDILEAQDISVGSSMH
jgi:hypothetical protein